MVCSGPIYVNQVVSFWMSAVADIDIVLMDKTGPQISKWILFSPSIRDHRGDPPNCTAKEEGHVSDTTCDVLMIEARGGRGSGKNTVISFA